MLHRGKAHFEVVASSHQIRCVIEESGLNIDNTGCQIVQTLGKRVDGLKVAGRTPAGYHHGLARLQDSIDGKIGDRMA